MLFECFKSMFNLSCYGQRLDADLKKKIITDGGDFQILSSLSHLVFFSFLEEL